MDDPVFDLLLTDARKNAVNQHYKKAFALYLRAFHKCSHMKKRLELEFRYVLTKLNDDLYETDDRSEIFNNFEIALRNFPGNANLLNLVGKYLYKYGFIREALCHFEKALKVDSSSVCIERNLNFLKRFLIPRKHIRNLNDKRKNEAYRRAIRQSVTQSVDSVLDFDAGTGLLTLYAAECRPVLITACDSSTTMVRLTECILGENDVHGIVVVNKPCGNLQYKDIYGTRTLLVTDMFDAGLFGGNILKNLTKAWECILSDEAKVLPGRAEYFIIGVNSKKLRDKYQLNEYAKKKIGISSKKVHSTMDYSYCSEDVSNYDDIEYVTEPASLLTIDFNSYDDIQDKLLRREPYSVELKAIENGEMTAVIGWFNLHLTEDVMLTNDPRSEERVDAWQPAVFFDYVTKQIKKRDVICLLVATHDGRMGLVTDLTDVTRVSHGLIKFLNDTEYMKGLVDSLAMNCVYLGQIVDITDTDVLDFSVFPLYGFELLKRGARSLICHAKTVADKEFIESIFKTNHIPDYKFSVMLESRIEEIWNHHEFRDKKFHLVFCNVLDVNGEVDGRKCQLAFHLCHAHLNEGGLFLPTQTTMYAQLVNSKTLERDNKIRDENVSGYKMAKYVNKYQVSHCSNIDINHLEYTALSEPIVASQVLSHTKGDVMNVLIIRDGVCSGILCWYEIYVKEDMLVKCTKEPGSFTGCVAFLTTPTLPLFKGETANIIRCIDRDGTLKLVVDTEM